MPAQKHALLIISAKLLLHAEALPLGSAVFRKLAHLTRHGTHLLLTAAEPDQWFPTRGSVDDVLGTQGRLLEQLQDSGGDLDGIYYVPKSVFTQDRKRHGALKDIAKRYGADCSDISLVSSSKAFIKAARKLGMTTHYIGLNDATAEEMGLLLEQLRTATTAPREQKNP